MRRFADRDVHMCRLCALSASEPWLVLKFYRTPTSPSSCAHAPRVLHARKTPAVVTARSCEKALAVSFL